MMNNDAVALLNEYRRNVEFNFSELSSMPFSKPYWIFISLSHRCNLDCRMCGVKHVLKGEDLDFDAVKKALDEVAAWNSDCVVLFTGGEPFLRKDIFDIIDYSVSLGIKTEVVSNGSLINNPRFATSIIDSGLKNIAVSLDGVCAATHDSIRAVDGAHSMAVNALSHLSQAKKNKGRGPQISAWVTIMNENVPELYDIISLAIKNGVECLVYHPVIVVQDDMQNTVKSSGLWIGEDKMGKLKEQIDKIVGYQKEHGLVAFLHDPYHWLEYFRGNLTRERWKCNPFVFIDIGPDGLVRSCGSAFGSIKDMTIEACLNTKEAHKAREKMSRCQRPCLQTCWSRPEADSLREIINNFIGKVRKLETGKIEKKRVLEKGLELLSGYEGLIAKGLRKYDRQA